MYRQRMTASVVHRRNGSLLVNNAHKTVGKNEKTVLDLANDHQRTSLLGWFPTKPKANLSNPD